MPKADNASNDSSEANKKDDSPFPTTVRANSAGLWWLIICGCITLVALLLLSIYLPHLTERVKFFTANALSLVVLLAIFVQVAINRRQWEAMREQTTAMQDGLTETRKMVTQNERAVEVAERGIEIAQENTINTQRAYVFIHKAHGKPPKENAEGAVYLEIMNAGNTPANDVEIYARAEVRDTLPDLNIDSATWLGGGILPPKEFISQLVMTIAPISSEQIKSLENLSLGFFIWGAIRYRDIFKNVRLTKFCVVMRKDPLGHRGYGPCPTGNEAD